MANLDRATGANFIPELWAEPIYKFFKRQNKLRGSVDDYSSMVKGQGDTIHIPKIALKAAVEKASSTAITFGTAAQAGKVDLSIDKHYVVPELFEDIALIQSNFELISKYTRMMGESIARQVDENMWDELDGFQTRQDLSANNTFGANDLETTLANLYAADLEPNMCSMAVNRLVLADIMHPSSGVASTLSVLTLLLEVDRNLKQVLLVLFMEWMCFIQMQLVLQQIMTSLLVLFMYQVLVHLQPNKM